MAPSAELLPGNLEQNCSQCLADAIALALNATPQKT